MAAALSIELAFSAMKHENDALTLGLECCQAARQACVARLREVYAQIELRDGRIESLSREIERLTEKLK